MSPPPPPTRRLIVPTLLTLGNAACGFAGVVWLTQPGADVAWVPWLMLAGWGFDMIDGTVAKALGATSAFGGQMDSLCDAITFGVLPGLLIAVVGGRTPLAMATGLLFLACVLVRLARFNVENTHDPEAHLYFKGLPSPSGALAIGAWVLGIEAMATHPAWAGLVPGGAATAHWALFAWAVALSLMMVGTRRYADLPKHYTRRLKPWWQVVLVAIGVAIAPWPLGLTVLATAYVLLGAVAVPPRATAP